MTLEEYLLKNFGGSSTVAAKVAVNSSTKKRFAQNHIFRIAKDPLYRVIKIDGVDTIVKVYGKFI
ncbi:hypothetical protein ACP6H1_27405 [Vibrio harveyi]|uniref:hypothetical protein n=1 Tax=Vibrio harveyi TaxID=669 RepID=UPI003CEBFE88